MSDNLTFGVRLEGSGSLVPKAKAARDEMVNLKQATDNLASSASKLASGSSGTEAAMRAQKQALAEVSGGVTALLDRYDPLGAKIRSLQADYKILDDALTRNASLSAGDAAKITTAQKAIQDEIKATQREMSGGVVAANNYADSLVSLAQKAVAAFGLWKIYDMARDATMLAARHETLGVSMRIVGNNAGYTAAQMEGYANELQSTGISMVESRQQVMRLAQAHVDLSQAHRLARIAQDAAVIGNMNSSQAFASMIHGIQTGQTDVLRTIGINISLEQSYSAYAKTLGISANELSAQQKMQAATNAVMVEGEKISGVYVEAMDTASKQINSLARYHENLQVTLGSTFTESLAAAVAAYTGSIKDLNLEAQDLKEKGDLKQFGRDASMALAFIADSANGAKTAVNLVGDSFAYVAALAAISARGFMARNAEERAALETQLNAIEAMHEAHQQEMLDSGSKYRDVVQASFDASDTKEAARNGKRESDAKLHQAAMYFIAAEGARSQSRLAQEVSDNMGGDVKAEYGTPDKPAAATGDTAKEKASAAAEIAAERGKYEEMLAVAQMADLKGEALMRAKESRDLDRMARERDREIAKHHGSLANQAQYEQAVVARVSQTEAEVAQLQAATLAKFQLERAANQQALLAIEVAGASSHRQGQMADGEYTRAMARAQGTWKLQDEANYQHGRAALETAAINQQHALKVRAAKGEHDLTVTRNAEKIIALRKGGMDEAKLQALINEDKLLVAKSLTQKLTDLEAKRLADIRALMVADAVADKAAKSEAQLFTDSLRDHDLGQAAKHGAAMTAGLTQHSRGMFEANKALSRANILINGPDAVVQSFRNGGGFPWGLIPAGLMAAEVAAQYAATNTEFGGGGSVPSVGSASAPSIPSPSYSGPSSQNNPPPATGIAAATQVTNITVIGAKENPDKAIFSYNWYVNTILPLEEAAARDGRRNQVNMIAG